MTGDGARRAVFLDRDGTLIEDVGYPDDPDGVRLVPGAADALAALRRGGFALVVVSNQSGIGRGLVTPEQAESVHERFVAELAAHGVELDDARYCPHAPDESCPCRKPSPGLLRDAASELGVDLAGSFMVGDKPSDVEAGRRAGCRTVLLAPAPGGEADFVAADWSEAVAYVLDGRS
jgi:D-glycero-D-manno-heptose 1,7-bisphosphate phosphatase